MKDFTYSDGRREAQAWLAHQLTWERVLDDLRHRHEDAGRPVALGDEVPTRAEAA